MIWKGHLYGAIIASIRQYRTTTQTGKYAEYHLAFCSHYVGDLSQPLHNTLYNDYNRRNHTATDGIIEGEALYNLALIEVYPINIQSEEDLAVEVARIANLSLNLGYKLELEGRMMSRQEAYEQISHSASLFRGDIGVAAKVMISDGNLYGKKNSLMLHADYFYHDWWPVNVGFGQSPYKERHSQYISGRYISVIDSFSQCNLQ